jgi:hypothetical protein
VLSKRLLVLRSSVTLRFSAHPIDPKGEDVGASALSRGEESHRLGELPALRERHPYGKSRADFAFEREHEAAQRFGPSFKPKDLKVYFREWKSVLKELTRFVTENFSYDRRYSQSINIKAPQLAEEIDTSRHHFSVESRL